MGLRVIAVDLQPRKRSLFPVNQGDGIEYPFEEGSVVMFCRPSHSGFVRTTILQALKCGVEAIVYVGLKRNVRHDLGGYFKKFVHRRIVGIGHANERIWEMTVGHAQTSLRRGAIPSLSSDYSE